MTFYPPDDQKMFVDHQGWRITKAWVRVGTKERTIYKVWRRNSDVWTPLDELFDSAEAAKQHIGDMK